MTLNVLSSGEKKKIVEDLKKNFGIEELPYLLIRSGKGKIRAYAGSFSREELNKLALKTRVEFLGLYALREEKQGYRIPYDAMFLFENLIKKNIIELNDEQAKEWLKGNEIIDKKFEKYEGLVALRNKGKIIGTSIVSNSKILNFVPKERRTR